MMLPAMGARLVDRALIAYARGPEHPAKIRAVHWLIRNLAAGRMRVCYASGAVVSIDPTDYLGWAILRTGGYEPASLELALRIVKERPGLFIDVGANFGWFSCAVAPITGAKVIAIEPDCTNCAALRLNLAGFANVTIVNAAVGASCDCLPISSRAPRNSGTVHIDIVGGSEPRDWVAATSLQQLLSRIVSPPERPVLVKIDVEGFEPQVLAGLDFDGPFRPRNIIMEFEPAFCSWDGIVAVEAFFAACGYDLLDVLGQPVTAAMELPEANVWARER
jgi:FkbM family methyltransferase